MIRLLRSVAARGILPALLLCACLPLRAEIHLDASLGFMESYRPDSWIPVTAFISGVGVNAGAELQLIFASQEGTTTYTKPIRLHAGPLNEQHTLCYYHSTSRTQPAVLLQLTVDGRKVAEKKLDRTFSVSETAPIILALTQDQSGLGYLHKSDLSYRHPGSGGRNYWQQQFGGGSTQIAPGANPVRVLYPMARALPDVPAGYASVDVIMLGDMPLDSLTEDQWNSIVTWVKDGGELIVSGGSDLNRLRSAPLVDLLPVVPSGVKQVNSLSAVGSRYEHDLKFAGTAVVNSTLRPGSTAVCSEEGQPLISYRRLGNGTVVFTSFDLTAPELRAWAGMPSLWQDMVHLSTSELEATEIVKQSSRGYGYSGYRGLADALAGLQATEAPGFTFIGLFLVLYIILLVPVNYFILRKLDRKELAWITSLVIIALFSTGAYALGYSIKGGQLFLRYASVVEGAANEDGFDAYTLATVFSPRQSRYDISVSDSGALATEATLDPNNFQPSAGDLTLVQDSRTHVKDALINMWDQRNFAFQSHLKLNGAISASAKYTGGVVDVKVTNHTRLTLTDSAISFHSQSVPVGTLAPGQTVQKTLAIGASAGTSRIGPVSFENNREANTGDRIKRSLSNVFLANEGGIEGADPLIFTGWLKEELTGLSLADEKPSQEGATLLVIHLPPPENGAPGRRFVPRTPRAAVISPNRGGFNMMGMSNAQRGVQAYGMKNYATAELYLKRAVKENPGDVQSFNMLAYALADQKKLDQALQAAQKALALAPSDGNILDSVGEMYQRKKDYKNAATYYQRSVKLQRGGGIAETHEKYGETLLALGKKNDAVTQLGFAAADAGQWGAKARAKLSSLGMLTPGSQFMAQSPPGTNTITVPNGKPVPPHPATTKGRRRILTPIGNGATRVTIETWNTSGGGSRQSSASTVVQPGQPIPP